MTTIRRPFKRFGTQVCDSRQRVVAVVDPHQLFSAGSVEAFADALCAWANAHYAEPPLPAAEDTGCDCTPAYLRRQAPTFSDHLSECELKRMMRDTRYWRDADPDFVERVRAGFRRLYNREGR